MKIFILSILLASGLGMKSCSDLSENEKLIFNKWVHSQEEQAEGKGQEVYRPADYKQFPPSRFRQVFEFKEDNKCEYMYLHPTDKHSMKPGTWTYDTKKNLITIKDIEEKEIYSITVIELQKDKLIIVRE